MKYRSVGRSGIKISAISLGSWLTDLKGTEKEKEAKAIVDKAYQWGVNFFDCADAYSQGAAERFLGEVLKAYPRRELVLSSKVFFPTGAGVNDRGLSRKHIMESCEQSLKNMQLDYLDFYFCHRFDESTSLEETLRAMSDLVSMGKILYYGVSEEWSSARIEEAEKIIERDHLHPITVLQPQYNMVDRYIEHDLIDTCRKYGIGITVFSPLSQGLLTGKYRKGHPLPKDSRATWQKDHQINDLLTDRNLDIVEKLDVLAKSLNTTLPILSLAWVLRREEISSAIIGASNLSQLETNLKAVDFTIPEDVLSKIDQILGFVRFERHVG